MRKSISAILLVLVSGLAGPAMAHGESKPKHGGTVQTAQDLSFEFVSKDGKLTIYVEDHGKARSTAGATGKLTVLNGNSKTELPLTPQGENELTVATDTTLTKGAKAIASVHFADKSTVNVRFVVN